MLKKFFADFVRVTLETYISDEYRKDIYVVSDRVTLKVCFHINNDNNKRESRNTLVQQKYTTTK